MKLTADVLVLDMEGRQRYRIIEVFPAEEIGDVPMVLIVDEMGRLKLITLESVTVMASNRRES